MQPAGARGRVPQSRGSAEHAADLPATLVSFPVPHDATVALGPRRVTFWFPARISTIHLPAPPF